MYKWTTLFFLFALAFSSCQDTIQVKLDEGSKLYVIDAFLQSGYAMQTVYIKHNSPYFDDKDPEPVLNAHIRFYDLAKNKNYDFVHAEKGKYVTFTDGNFYGEIGGQYRLDVMIDGVTYSATTTMCRGAKIDSISHEFYDTDALGRKVPTYALCTLWAKDKADNNPDYYWIKEISADTNQVNVCIDGTGGVVKDATADSLYFTAPYNLMGLRRYRPGSACNVEIHAITKETYQFLVQVKDQITNGGLFAKTPENVKTNIITPADAKIKAVGWFSLSNRAHFGKLLN
jgi:hypothetical protein